MLTASNFAAVSSSKSSNTGKKLVDSCQTCRSSAIDAPRDNIRRSGLQQSCDIGSRACDTTHYCSKHCHQRPSYGPARTQPRNSARARSNIGTSDCCRTGANSDTESDCRAAYTDSRFAADFCAGSHGDTLGDTGRPSIRSRRFKRQGNGFSLGVYSRLQPQAERHRPGTGGGGVPGISV